MISQDQFVYQKHKAFYCFHVLRFFHLFYVSVTSIFHNSIFKINKTVGNPGLLGISEKTALLRKKIQKNANILFGSPPQQDNSKNKI